MNRPRGSACAAGIAWGAFAVALLAPRPGETSKEYPLPDPLRLVDAIRLAREQRAEVSAATESARAAAQRPAIVSSLPDPMIMLSLDHLPLPRPSGVDFNGLFQQDFPLSRIRGHRLRGARASAHRATTEVERTALDVELAATGALLMLDERRRTALLIEEQTALAHKIVTIARGHYAAGQGSLAESLRADGEAARLHAERHAIAAEIGAAAAMLNAALARPIDAPIPALDPQLDPSIAPREVGVLIAGAIAHRPELIGAQQERARARAEVDAMRSMYVPMAFVRAGPAYTMEGGAGAMVMIGLTLPIWRTRLSAGVEEARAMARMADAEVEAMRTMITGETAAAREEVEAWRARLTGLKTEVLPRMAKAVDASTASYAAGQTALVSTLETLRAQYDLKREAIMARTALGLAHARLRRAVGDSEPTP